MRKRTLLIVAPLCVVALAAGVAVAAPPGREQAGDAKLDNPHPVRPIAASPSVFELNSLSAILDPVVSLVRDAQAREIASFVHDAEAQAIGDFLNSIAAQQASQGRRYVPAASGNTGGGGDNGDFLSCVRWRESRGDYSVHNSQGSGASGAYQFMPGTWNSIAGAEGRSDLVGMDPAAAAPGDQDAMAVALYNQQGASPWGGGC